MNNYKYIKVLQADYGNGWEDELTYTNTEWKEIRDDLRAYRLNAPQYQYRVINRRELIDREPKRSMYIDSNTGKRIYLN